uniref:Uncharacterized protein n=1 Tax=viral metagenome TaxID=1070528 RepID=A0A6C0I446_9ZZZZ
MVWSLYGPYKHIQSGKNPSDVIPEIHTLEKKLKAFEKTQMEN